MHETRLELLDLIKQCPKKQQQFFKRMYSHDNMDLSLVEVIKKMDTVSIIIGIRQTKRTILRNQDKIELKIHKLKNNILKNEN